MIIDIKQFAALEKASKTSFFEQKKLLKQLMLGKPVFCDVCKQPLILHTPVKDEKTGIRCKKGCTDILLDFV